MPRPDFRISPPYPDYANLTDQHGRSFKDVASLTDSVRPTEILPGVHGLSSHPWVVRDLRAGDRFEFGIKVNVQNRPDAISIRALDQYIPDTVPVDIPIIVEAYGPAVASGAGDGQPADLAVMIAKNKGTQRAFRRYYVVG